MDSQFFPLSRKEAKELGGVEELSRKNKAAGFPRRLQTLRKKAGISQERLADEVDVSKSAIGYYETGDNVPDAKTLYKLAQYYKVTADYLLGLTDDPSKKPAAVDELGISPRTVERISSLDKNIIVYNDDGGDGIGEYADIKAIFCAFAESEYFNQFVASLAGAIYYERQAKGESDLVFSKSEKPVTEQNPNAAKAALQSMIAWESIRRFTREAAQNGEYSED